MKISILDLDNNNIFSLLSACKKIGYNSNVITKNDISKEKIKKTDIMILPGVGNFSYTMKKIKRYGFDDLLYEYALQQKKKLIGICLGMQLFFDESEETTRTKGLQLIEGKVYKLKNLPKVNFPNIGWNKIKVLKKNLKFFNNKYFYFVHGYHCVPKKKEIITSNFNYGDYKICASFQKENLIGIQFHPEKSGKEGLMYLKTLLENT